MVSSAQVVEGLWFHFDESQVLADRGGGGIVLPFASSGSSVHQRAVALGWCRRCGIGELFVVARALVTRERFVHTARA